LLTRRKFLYTGAAAATGIAALGLDGFAQSKHVQLRRVEIPLARLPEAFDGFTIAQLSDFHYDPEFSVSPIRKAVAMVNGLKPDLIALTGDFVTVAMFHLHARNSIRSARTAFPCAELLQPLQAASGKFAVLGNHDVASHSAIVSGALHAHGIPVLANRAVPVERGSSRIWIAGVEDALEGRPDLGAALRGIPSSETVIVLAHEPDFADEAALNPVDLQLSGHSHGGQIWIPGIGAPWLPALARKYPRGLNQVGRLTVYTNIGIGTIRAPIRVNCTPEVTLITLRTRRS
jgi:predicted MPP superfamily phosphohydrolase